MKDAAKVFQVVLVIIVGAFVGYLIAHLTSLGEVVLWGLITALVLLTISVYNTTTR